MKALKLPVFFALIFLSRLPFIFSGYGAEEDAWGLAVNAFKMEKTGSYEVSRLPGHPVQEYIYAWMPWKSAVAFNLLTVIISTAGLFLFYRILKKLQMQNALIVTAALAFIPVFYINCTNDMDYTWAVAFAFGAWYLILEKKYFAAGFFLALAIGCRITSGAFVLPFVYLIFSQSKINESKDGLKSAAQFIFSMTLFAFLFFIPVLKNYGPGFFGYVNQFGYPPLIKSAFKTTVGVFGIAGFLFTAVLFMYVIVQFFKNSLSKAEKQLFIFSMSGILIFIIAFLPEPHKSAYLIPVLPFVILLLGPFVKKPVFRIYMLTLLANCFFMGINLADENRSGNPSTIAITKKIDGQFVSFDILKGPIIDDREKRLARIDYANKVVAMLSSFQNPSFVVCGYWLNTILIQQQKSPAPNATLVYYADEKMLADYSNKKTELFFLPMQDVWNDKCYGYEFTARYAKPFPVP